MGLGKDLTDSLIKKPGKEWSDYWDKELDGTLTGALRKGIKNAASSSAQASKAREEEERRLREEEERRKAEEFQQELNAILSAQFDYSDPAVYEAQLKQFIRMYMEKVYVPKGHWWSPIWLAHTLNEQNLKRKQAYEKRLLEEFDLIENKNPDLYKKFYPDFKSEVDMFPIMKKMRLKSILLIIGVSIFAVIAFFTFIIIAALNAPKPTPSVDLQEIFNKLGK